MLTHDINKVRYNEANEYDLTGSCIELVWGPKSLKNYFLKPHNKHRSAVRWYRPVWSNIFHCLKCRQTRGVS